MESAAAARTFTPRTLVLTGMIAFAVGVRLLIHFVPGVLPWHFTPVEAIALFGGAYFSDRRTALIVPLAAMLVSDLIIGTYALMPVIYACIAASTVLGFGLRGRATALRVAGYGVAGSVLFFVVTNFAEWAVGGTEFCRAGLLPCYVAALPFFKTWLAGTLAWSALLFGGFALLGRSFPALAPQPARA
ncbi:hypothetical protein MBSD_n1296 [Mizugakiibacter sediminis]|uniref:Rod shape-determining protein MreD n=1 Tax=Mizugakiibacter sediminis TaxID=1475481 RepID=A0A0K8QM91_9GAMM|nr:DUF6580 family putative transport protein [Mizugakiibacter sediminis]GAP65994.1 hypothetical protein MBSD_n1296 [Mizugakiibacter sediminis]